MIALTSPPDPVGAPPPRPRDVHPCFGIGCTARGSCACYDAVEDSPQGTPSRGTCVRDGTYPGYLDRALRTAWPPATAGVAELTPDLESGLAPALARPLKP